MSGDDDYCDGDYGMFTKAGEEAVAAMVAEALTINHDERGAYLQVTVQEISRKHPEVFDTYVREAIAAALGWPALAYWTLAKGAD